MPYVYGWQTKMVAENYATSGSANTGIDFLFIKPGATRPVGLAGLRPIGKGAALTALSGIAIRAQQWTGGASSGGTAVTPTPVNNTAPACAHTMGMGAAGGTGAVTSGTTAAYAGGCGHGASGPGGWAPLNPDALPALDGGANKSIDLFSASGQASLNFEVYGENSEFGF
jgi:hypothetical protein